MPKKLTKQQIAYNNNIPLDLSLPKTLKAAVIKRDYHSVKRLLGKGANPNEQDAKGRTPLHFAVKDNRLYITNLLIKDGAHILIKDKANFTPLDYALIYNHTALKNLLEQRLHIINRGIYNFFTGNKAFLSTENENNENRLEIKNYSR